MSLLKQRRIPSWKQELADKIAGLAAKYPTILVADLTGIPAKHIQRLRKKLDKIAVVMTVKPRIALKAFKAVGLPVEKLEPYMNGQIMLIFSEKNSFELANIIKNFVTNDYYSPGEVVDREIIIPEGNTGLPAGPILSTFGRLKIQTRVVGNVIHVARDTVVAKPGDTVSEDLASLMQKLGLALKEIRLKIKCGLDGRVFIQGEKLVLNVSEYEEQLKLAHMYAFKLATELVIPEPPVIEYSLIKAHRQAVILSIEIGYIAPETIVHVLSTAHMKALALAAEISKHAPELGLEVKVVQRTRQVEEKREEEKEEKKEESGESSEETLSEGFASLFG